jgi:hypothetical protein
MFITAVKQTLEALHQFGDAYKPASLTRTVT